MVEDLFEKEEQVLQHARDFLSGLTTPQEYRREYEDLTGAYAEILRQLRWVTRISDLTAQGLNTEKRMLLKKVNVDALTELYNRRFLMTNLDHYLSVLGSIGSCITVMMLDIDFFKNYNDTYGHPVGDICLRKVANTIHNALGGAEDFVVRYGGEEFIAVMPGADRDLGMYAAQKILHNVWDLHIAHEKSECADRITVSIGMVSAIPAADHRMQQYIDRADQALYQSKNRGRNQITCVEL